MTKIYIGIKLVPAHQEEGCQVPAAVESVFANLPAEYFEVKVVEPEIGVDAAGDLNRMITEFGSEEETELKYPYEVFTTNTYRQDDFDPTLQRGEEFSVMFKENQDADIRHLLVLNAPTMEKALLRVRQTYPEAVVIRAEQTYVDHSETARELLDREILVVNPDSDGN